MILVAKKYSEIHLQKDNSDFTADLADHSTAFVLLFHLNKYRSELIEKK
jgi:hypothetical protein